MPVAYQDWLQMPVVQDATKEVIDRYYLFAGSFGVVIGAELKSGALAPAAILHGGILKPRAFPHVQIDIAQIWPD